MEYRTNEIKTIINYIRTSSDAQAAAFITLYGDVREERGIEAGWSRCTTVHRKCRAARLKRERAFVLEADNNYVEVHELNKLLYPILDMLEARDMSDEIAQIEAMLGKVKLDRRLTFLND